jgi:tRNA A37 threonylcarbamoyltransferase TsaD
MNSRPMRRGLSGSHCRGAGQEIAESAEADRLKQLVVAGGVGANKQLRSTLNTRQKISAFASITRNWNFAPTTAR